MDPILRLRDDANLLRLLSHYAGLVQEDRKIWQDRLMALEGIDGATLARLHGELIAGDWLEINVGSPSGKRPGAVESSYRVTAQGLRAEQRIRAGTVDEEEEVILQLPDPRPAKAPPRFNRRSKKANPDPTPPQAA